MRRALGITGMREPKAESRMRLDLSLFILDEKDMRLCRIWVFRSVPPLRMSVAVETGLSSRNTICTLHSGLGLYIAITSATWLAPYRPTEFGICRMSDGVGRLLCILI